MQAFSFNSRPNDYKIIGLSTLPQFTISNLIQKVFPYQLLLPIPQLKHLKENLVSFWSVMEAIVPTVVK